MTLKLSDFLSILFVCSLGNLIVAEVIEVVYECVTTLRRQPQDIIILVLYSAWSVEPLMKDPSLATSDKGQVVMSPYLHSPVLLWGKPF